MKTLELSMLMHGAFCHNGRSYLAYLQSGGFRLRKIVLLRDARFPQPLTQERAAGWSLEQLAEKNDDFVFERRRGDAHFLRTNARVQEHFEVPVDLLTRKRADDFFEYADEVEEVFIDSYEDARIRAAIARQEQRTFIYACGPVLKAPFFEIEGARYIHVHSGLFPEFRGADTLLWSFLYGRPTGLTCFYLAGELDMGDVIGKHPVELGGLRLPAAERDPAQLYRLWFFAYDPHLRAQCLLSAVQEGRWEGGSLLGEPQETGVGRMHFVMHARLRALAMQRVFPAEDGPGDQ